MSIPRLQPPHRGCKACRSRHGRASMERERVADLRRKLVGAQAYAEDHPETMPQVLKTAAKLKAAVTRANQATEDYEAHRAEHPAWDDVDDPWHHDTRPRYDTPLPGGGELAAMVAAGETIEEIAATFGRVPGTIRDTISRAGFSSTTGQPRRTSADGLPALPTPFEDPAWMAEANCAGTDPEIFYPAVGGSPRPAQRICSRCPVTAQCLAYAVEIQDQHGVWGGISPRSRRGLTVQEAS